MSVYAWADLHGRLDIFNEGLKYLNSEDKIYFLGDAADRGPDGWEIIKKIITDPRFIYIKGNHENFMVNALKNFHDSDEYWNFTYEIEIWYWNGGESTHNAFYEDTSISDEEKKNILKTLKDLPFVYIYHNTNNQDIILSHSGYNDIDNRNEEKFLWDRSHLMFYDDWHGTDNEYIVHGHTPIELMIEDQEKNARWYDDIPPEPWFGRGAYWYGQGHKCNIDTGAVWNNHSVLLNLDTWKETIITLT